jgi:hypothetical protein
MLKSVRYQHSHCEPHQIETIMGACLTIAVLMLRNIEGSTSLGRGDAAD